MGDNYTTCAEDRSGLGMHIDNSGAQAGVLGPMVAIHEIENPATPLIVAVHINYARWERLG